MSPNGFFKVFFLASVALLLSSLSLTAYPSYSSPDTSVTVIGRVTYYSGEPAANVNVTLLCMTCGGIYVSSSTTNSSGEYSLVIPPQYLTGYKIALWVEAPGYLKIERYLSPQLGQSLMIVDLTLEKEVDRQTELWLAWLRFEDGFIAILTGSLLAVGILAISASGVGTLIKTSLTDRLSRNVGIVSAVVTATVYLFLSVGISGGWVSGIQPLAVFLTITTSMLAGMTIALFVFSFGRCRAKRTKEYSVGFFGVFSSIPAALAACPICVQPILFAILGVSSALLFSQYRVLLVTLPMAAMLISIFLMARSLDKGECKTRSHTF